MGEVKEKALCSWGDGPFDNSIAQDFVHNLVTSRKRSLSFVAEYFKGQKASQCDLTELAILELVNIAKGRSKHAEQVPAFSRWLGDHGVKVAGKTERSLHDYFEREDVAARLDSNPAINSKQVSDSLRNLKKDSVRLKDVSLDFAKAKKFCDSSSLDNLLAKNRTGASIYLYWIDAPTAVQLGRFQGITSVELTIDEKMDWKSMIYPLRLLLRSCADSLTSLKCTCKFGSEVGAFCETMLPEFQSLSNITHFHFEDFPLGDKEFVALAKGKPIRVVDVRDSVLTGKCLECLNYSKTLKTLVIVDSKVSKAAASRFKKQNPNLHLLRFE